jgi:predicted ATPase
LVGAQGTGKSIFLQLFKLSRDQNYVTQHSQDLENRKSLS